MGSAMLVWVMLCCVVIVTGCAVASLAMSRGRRRATPEELARDEALELRHEAARDAQNAREHELEMAKVANVARQTAIDEQSAAAHRASLAATDAVRSALIGKAQELAPQMAAALDAWVTSLRNTAPSSGRIDAEFADAVGGKGYAAASPAEVAAVAYHREVAALRDYLERAYTLEFLAPASEGQGVATIAMGLLEELRQRRLDEAAAKNPPPTGELTHPWPPRAAGAAPRPAVT